MLRGVGVDVKGDGRVKKRYSRVQNWDEAFKPSIFRGGEYATPEQALGSLMRALVIGKEEGVRSATTEKGYKSLTRLFEPELGKERFSRSGKRWLIMELHWGERTAERAEAHWGPAIKAAGLFFVKTDEGWKLDSWLPGQ